MKDETIETYSKWSRNPSYHGSYDDYVAHMKASFRYEQKERERRLVKKIAKRVVQKLKKG